MTRHPYRLWIAALLLGWFIDFLFWKQRVGINFVLFISACLLVGFGLLWMTGLRSAGKSLLLLAPLAFFALMSYMRQEPLTLFLAVAMCVVLLGLLAVTYLGGRWAEYGMFDYMVKALNLVEHFFIGGDQFNRQVRKEQAERGEPVRKLPVGPVARGLVIAAPILWLFSYLFASADIVYNHQVSEFFRSFEPDKIGDLLLQLALILGCSYGMAGVLVYAATKSQDAKLLSEGKPVVKTFLGFTEAVTVLGSVAALFLVFVVIQFRYFFGGQQNIGIQGFTYSEYARRGFNELVIVAFLSLLLTLGLSIVTRREGERQRRIFSGLSVGIAAFVIVILVSAYQRLSLAIDWHGFSRLRVYPRVFLVWVGILFVVVVLLELFHQERRFALAALLASIGFAASLSLLNVDASIAHHNIYRLTNVTGQKQGTHFNVSYLTSLSTDAIPTLVDAFSDSTLPKSTHEGIGAALLCYQYPDTLKIFEEVDWRSMNASSREARRTLGMRPDLKGQGYLVNQDPSLTRVRTPGGEWYDCAGTN